MSTEKKCQTFAKVDRVRILLSDRQLNNAGLNRADVDGVYVVDCQQPDFLGKQTYYISREVRCPDKVHQIFHVTCCQIEKVPAAEPSCALSRQPQPSPTLCNQCDKSPIPTGAGAGDDGDEFDSDIDDDSDLDDDSEDDLFVVGDTVRLASGGPSMTITSIDDKTKIAICDYFSFNEYKFKRERFALSCLIFADD